MAEPQIPKGVPVFRVHTTMSLSAAGVGGVDSCIASLPPEFFTANALDVRLVGRLLRELSEGQAAKHDVKLHHADWVVTSDPAVLEVVGACVHGSCVKCRAELDQVLAMLREHPGTPVFAGLLFWAALDA